MTQLGEIILLAIIVLVIDLGFLWAMRNYFNGQIRAIQGTNISINYLAGILCYVVIIACLYKFIILSGASKLDAAMLGWSVYLIYELTNKALFNSWAWETVLIDGIWGGILFAISTYIYKIIKSKF